MIILIKNIRNAIIISGSEGKNKFTSKSLKNEYKGMERGTKKTINNKKLSNRTKAINNASNKRGRNIKYCIPSLSKRKPCNKINSTATT